MSIIDDYERTQRIRIEEMKAVGERAVKDAEENLKNAEAAAKWEEVKRLREELRQHKRAVAIAEREDFGLRRKLSEARRIVADLGYFRSPESAGNAAIQRAWEAFRVTMRYASPEATALRLKIVAITDEKERSKVGFIGSTAAEFTDFMRLIDLLDRDYQEKVAGGS